MRVLEPMVVRQSPLDDVDRPCVAAVLEVEEDAGHVGSIGGLAVDRPLGHTGCRRDRLSMARAFTLARRPSRRSTRRTRTATSAIRSLR
jgi:hypothetical protein